MGTLKLILGCLIVATSAGCTGSQRPDGGVGLLQAGTAVTPLQGVDQRGQRVTLAFPTDHLSVVYFYPRDATPGCTAEACAFRDVWDEYERRGIRIYGVSSDDVASHAEFAREHHLPFPLVADINHEWARAFGVPSTLGFYSRVTFLLGRDGHVLATYEDVDPGLHAREILRDAERLAPRVAEPSASGRSSAEALLAPAPRLDRHAAQSVALDLQAGRSPESRNESVFWLAAKLEPPPGAHLSWKHTLSGGLPTRVEFFGPPEFAIDAPLYPGPTRLENDAGPARFGYQGPIVVLARVSAKPGVMGPHRFQVHGTWLSCDSRCVKEEQTESVVWSPASEALSDLPTWLERVPASGDAAGFIAHAGAHDRTITLSAPSDWKLLDVFPERDVLPDEELPRLPPNVAVARLRYSGEVPPRLTVRARSQSNLERFFSVPVLMP